MTYCTHHALRSWRELWSATQGLALMEFAFLLPLLMILGVGGIEVAHYVNVRLTLSQTALTLADNASRVGHGSLLTNKTLDESDINDILDGAVNQAGGLNLKQNGRIILSSLEVNAQNGQWLHWQRCHGDRTDFPSHYGQAGLGETGNSYAGIGIDGAPITATPNSAVMFVELQYQYQPVFAMTSSLLQNNIINYTAAYTVRDPRNLSQITNSANVPVRSCTS